MKRRLQILTLILIVPFFAQSQNVGINSTGTTPAASTILDLNSGNTFTGGLGKGFLVPCMYSADINLINSPATGLLVFNLDCYVFEYWNKSAWITFPASTYAPSAPTTITGNLNPCINSGGNTYSVTGVAGTTYTWTVPSGASITSGQTTNSIVVTFGTTNGNICVTASNNCGSSTNYCMAITLASPPGAAIASVSPNPVCSGNTVGFTGNCTGATTWSWAGPNHFSSSSQNPTLHIVSYLEQSGTYTLTASNGCAAASPVTTTLVADTETHGTNTYNYEPVAASPAVNTGVLQTFTVPTCITTLTVTAYGAQGGTTFDGDGTGGLGAEVEAIVTVTPGDAIDILVGDQGQANASGGQGAGGGGGSFVVDYTNSNEPLVIASGGGGGGGNGANNGTAGSATFSGTSGTSGGGSYSGAGGTNGGGGGGSADNGGCESSGGGGGFYGSGGANGNGGGSPGAGGTGMTLPAANGGAGGNNNICNTSGGASYLLGGNGGAGCDIGGGCASTLGGYGGGSGTAGGGGGGGGGYSGGGGGGYNGSTSGGGGGGSYYNGSLISKSGGVRTGNGEVIITW